MSATDRPQRPLRASIDHPVTSHRHNLGSALSIGGFLPPSDARATSRLAHRRSFRRAVRFPARCRDALSSGGAAVQEVRRPAALPVPQPVQGVGKALVPPLGWVGLQGRAPAWGRAAASEPPCAPHRPPGLPQSFVGRGACGPIRGREDGRGAAPCLEREVTVRPRRIPARLAPIVWSCCPPVLCLVGQTGNDCVIGVTRHDALASKSRGDVVLKASELG